MFRAFITYLLVGVLLACPFVCLRKAGVGECIASAGGSSEGDCGHDDDCCCPASGSRSDGSGPAAPQRGGGGTCLCHGAVMDRHAPPPIPELQFLLPPAADDPAQHHGLALGDNALALDPSACDFATVSSGRILRALIASLLI